MKITYDKKVDALNLSLRAGIVSKTLEIAPEIMVDMDKKGNTLNIEIVGASHQDYMRYFGNSWNLTVADFVTKLMIASKNINDLTSFLGGNSHVRLEDGVYIVCLAGIVDARCSP